MGDSSHFASCRTSKQVTAYDHLAMVNAHYRPEKPCHSHVPSISSILHPNPQAGGRREGTGETRQFENKSNVGGINHHLCSPQPQVYCPAFPEESHYIWTYFMLFLFGRCFGSVCPRSPDPRRSSSLTSASRSSSHETAPRSAM